ncbi:MAG TPA: DUF455 family protein [Rhodothermales bacterium]|nr:DUF455 family protein [Rhodothermales bacterium]
MRTEPGIGVFPLTDRLRRVAHIESASIKHLSGWFLRARPYENKHRLGYHVWNHAEHTNWLRERLQFLRGGLRNASLDPAFLDFVDLTCHAPSDYAYLRGAYQVLKPALLAFYEETLAQCDPSANAYDARLIKRIIPEIREQIEWGESVLQGDPDPETSQAWADFLQETLDAIGGLSSSGTPKGVVSREHSLVTPFTLPDSILFDDRIADKPLTPHDEKVKLPYEDALREQFRVFFNEIYAASMLAALLYDSFDQDMSWDFIYDFSRHFWDECRHSEFGAVRLKELGYEPDRCDQTLFLNSLSMPLLHRVCYLTMVLEAYYMPRKKPRFKEYEEAGDTRSQLFADHDWSDEINHVRLGKDWLEKLLEDDARDIAQLKEETTAILEQRAGEPLAQISPF